MHLLDWTIIRQSTFATFTPFFLRLFVAVLSARGRPQAEAAVEAATNQDDRMVVISSTASL